MFQTLKEWVLPCSLGYNHKKTSRLLLKTAETVGLPCCEKFLAMGRLLVPCGLMLVGSRKKK